MTSQSNCVFLENGEYSDVEVTVVYSDFESIIPGEAGEGSKRKPPWETRTVHPLQTYGPIPQSDSSQSLSVIQAFASEMIARRGDAGFASFCSLCLGINLPHPISRVSLTLDTRMERFATVIDDDASF